MALLLLLVFRKDAPNKSLDMMSQSDRMVYFQKRELPSREDSIIIKTVIDGGEFIISYQRRVIRIAYLIKNGTQ